MKLDYIKYNISSKTGSDWIHTFLMLSKWRDHHYLHADSWLPLAVKKMTAHTIISLSLPLCLCVSSPAVAFHIEHQHLRTLNCHIRRSLTPSPSVPHLNPFKNYTAEFCLHLVHVLCIRALGHVQKCVSHFCCAFWFSFLSFVFLFYFFFNESCITLFWFSVFVLRMAMILDCLVF